MKNSISRILLVAMLMISNLALALEINVPDKGNLRVLTIGGSSYEEGRKYQVFTINFYDHPAATWAGLVDRGDRKLLEFSEEIQGDTLRYYYSVFARGSVRVAKHEIPENTYRRLISVFYNSNRNEYVDTNDYLKKIGFEADEKLPRKILVYPCLVTVSIDRETMKLVEVAPRCDDLK